MRIQTFGFGGPGKEGAGKPKKRELVTGTVSYGSKLRRKTDGKEEIEPP
jgi:hypothetical protein